MRLTIIAALLPVVAVLMWSPAPSAAQQLNDFAFGNRLVTPSNTALAKIMLPDRIRRRLAQNDGGDIRIFDAEGAVVPHFRPPSVAGSGLSPVVFFVSQAGQSYLLAYGSRKVTAPMPPMELVQRAGREGRRAAAVRVGPRVELGGPARLQATAATPGRMVSLSTLLLGGVLLLAVFAWWTARRLLRG